MTPTLVVVLTIASFFTAMLSGAAGLGGGTILIAVIYAVGLPPVTAVSLFSAVQTLANGSRTIAYLRHVDWRAAGWFLLGSVPTPFLFAPLVARADPAPLQILLAAMILVSLIAEERGVKPLPPRVAFVLGGLLNGTIGMFVGATGLFVGKLYLRPEWDKERVVATLAMTQMLGHLLKVLGFASIGATLGLDPRLMLPIGAAVVAGTFCGRYANRWIDEVLFRKLFKSILLLLSVKLLFDGGTDMLGL